MTDFNFLPRKLANRHKEKVVVRQKSPSTTSSVLQEVNESKKNKNNVHSNKSISSRPEDNSFCTDGLLLALSEHAIWSDEKLFGIMDSHDGYVTLSYVLRESPVFSGMSPVPPESTFIRATKDNPIFERRMIVSESAGDHQIGCSELDGSQSGFEIRRRDWLEVRDRIRKCTQYHWDNNTIYVENLPHSARSHVTVYQFIRDLMNDSGEDVLQPIVLSIYFPPHRDDRPNDLLPTKSKGFAFVVLSQVKVVDQLLDRWPWNLQERHTIRAAPNSLVLEEALNYGLRCLSKRSWDNLKNKYIELQELLLKKTISSSMSASSLTLKVPLANTINEAREIASENNSVEPRHHAKQDPDSLLTVPEYPVDCLVFVKNIHSETSKTILKQLFLSWTRNQNLVIDYVDYTKGLNNCYLRFQTSLHAKCFVEHIISSKVKQASGLDDTGLCPSPGDEAIEAELVQGKREEIYWEKIPEKIRRQAVVRALENDSTLGESSRIIAESEGRKGKRRRQG